MGKSEFAIDAKDFLKSLDDRHSVRKSCRKLERIDSQIEAFTQITPTFIESLRGY